MDRHEEGVVRLLHRVDRLIELGLNPEWLSHDIRRYVEAAASLHLRGHPVNQLSVKLIAGENGRWPEVEQFFAKGGVDPKDVVSSALAHYMTTEAEPLITEASKKLHSKSDEIHDWLPELTRKLSTLCQRGEVYDASPKAHFTKPIPQVQHTFGGWMDVLLRGGLYNGCVGIISSAPSGGKSTMAYTIAAKACNTGVKSIIITGEELEQGVVARVLMAQTGLPKATVISFQSLVRGETNQMVTQKEFDILDKAFGLQNSYLRVYNYEAMELGRMEDIVAWERPALMQVDHLLMVHDPTQKSRGSSAFDIGSLIYGIQRMAVQRHALQAIVYSQLPENIVKMLKDGKAPKHVTFYGSGMVNQAAHWSAVTYRHPGLPGWNRWWYIKDKVLNQDSDQYRVEHDPFSQSYVGMDKEKWS